MLLTDIKFNLQKVREEIIHSLAKRRKLMYEQKVICHTLNYFLSMNISLYLCIVYISFSMIVHQLTTSRRSRRNSSMSILSFASSSSPPVASSESLLQRRRRRLQLNLHSINSLIVALSLYYCLPLMSSIISTSYLKLFHKSGSQNWH